MRVHLLQRPIDRVVVLDSYLRPGLIRPTSQPRHAQVAEQRREVAIEMPDAAEIGPCPDELHESVVQQVVRGFRVTLCQPARGT